MKEITLEYIKYKIKMGKLIFKVGKMKAIKILIVLMYSTLKFNSYQNLSREDSSMIFLIDLKIHGDGHYCKNVKTNINEVC